MFYAVDDSCNITLRTLPFTRRCDSLLVHDIVHVGMILLLSLIFSSFYPLPLSHAVSCGFGSSACHSSDKDGDQSHQI